MITLALTSWNRDSMTFESFRQVLNDDRISEIVIVDDHSDVRIYDNLVSMCKGIDKVKIHRNDTNLGCYHNKRRAVELASNEWVILFDSDNVIKKDYLDSLLDSKPGTYFKQSDTIYQPEWAKPHFDFRKFAGSVITKDNVKGYMRQQHFTTMLNAMNFLVNREEFLKIPHDSEEKWTADSIYFNYLWLREGNKIYVTPGMQYEHRVNNHGDQEPSHYKTNVHKTGNLYKEVENLIMQL